MSGKRRLKDLKIDLIESSKKISHPPAYHEVLPKHEFSMLIVAPKGSGKTNFLCNLILKHYKGYFHRIIVCSPTIDNDDKWDIVKGTKHILAENKRLEEIANGRSKNGVKPVSKVVFKDEPALMKQSKADEEKEDKFDGKIPDDDFFSDLDQVPEKIGEQQAIIKRLHELGYDENAKYIADRVLVILDDQAGMFKGGNTNNPMVNYVIKHRHSSSSVIIVTQAYKAIPKTIRTNCNALVLFEIPNLSERKVIYEENPEGMSEDEWMQVYKHATHEPFSFMYMNNKFPRGERVYKNFDCLLQVGRAEKDPKDDDETTVNSRR
jgi:hypothetical protein